MTYASEVLADSPSLYWRLGEASNSDPAADASGNGRDGFYNSSPVTGVTGLQTSDSDTAVQFGGGSDGVDQTTPDFAPGTIPVFSIEAIFKLSSFSASAAVVAAIWDPADSASDIIDLQISGTSPNKFLSFIFQGTSGFYFCGSLGTTPVALGTTYHVVGVFDGTDLVVYINGAAATTTNHPDAGAVLTVTDGFYAANISSHVYPLTGVLDEVAFYETALSPARVLAHYNASIAAPPPPPAPASGFQMRTVTMLGVELDVLPLANLESVEWTLNQPDTYAFYFPKYAYDEATVPVLGDLTRVVEVQVWTTVDGVRDVLLAWGPIVDLQTAGSDGAMHATGVGVDWYLTRRYIDGQRPNLLTNPSFESAGGSLGGWTDGGAVTSSVTTDAKVEGTHSARLVASGPFADEHIYQAFDVTAGVLGLLLTVTGWFLIESFVAPAYAARGLFVEGVEGSTVRATSVVMIDENTPVGVWQRAETTIWIPPLKTWTINPRGYALDSILWDELQVVAMDSTGTNGAEDDVAHLCRIALLHLQDGTIKSNVLIIPPDTGDTVGISEAKQWQWADHIAWDQQLREWVDRSDGIDYAIIYDGVAGTRTFVPYRPRGADLTGDVHLTFPGNLSDYRWHRDGSATITEATVLGDGDGPDREEGHYTDASLIGGLTLEDVSQAPTGTAVSSLLPLAQGRVELSHDPPLVLEVDIRPDATGEIGGAFDGMNLLGVLVTGDKTPVTINDGYVQESASLWRIAKLHLDGKDRVLTATLNRTT